MKAYKIDKLGEEGIQNIQFELYNGKIIDLKFYFNGNINYWFLDIEYEDFKLYGIQVVYSDNLLYQYKNILPFGILVDSESGLSPITINSFLTGINNIYVITNE